MRILHLAVAFSLLVANPSFGALCMPNDPRPQDSSAYVAALLEAFTAGYEPIQRVGSQDARIAEDGLLTKATALMAEMKSTQSDYECAAAHVRPYVTSSDEAISTSAQAAQMVFESLAQLANDSVVRYRDLLNGQLAGDNLGSIAEAEAESRAAFDDTWRMLPLAAVAATYALVEIGGEGKPTGKLKLTAAAREQLREQLHETFGSQVDHGMKTGQIPIVAAAAILYDFLGKADWKSRE